MLYNYFNLYDFPTLLRNMSYKDKDIGTHSELVDNMRNYLVFLRYINIRLPYPDEIYVPQEF